jgi:hypothetical protein
MKLVVGSREVETGIGEEPARIITKTDARTITTVKAVEVLGKVGEIVKVCKLTTRKAVSAIIMTAIGIITEILTRPFSDRPRMRW